MRDADGNAGACACVVVPWFERRYPQAEWPRLAWWLYDHLPFHRAVFFSRQTAFNIGWRDSPRHEISATCEPKGVLVGTGKPPAAGCEALYADFPPFRGLPSP